MYLNKNFINIDFLKNPGSLVILISGIICIISTFVFLPLGVITFFGFIYLIIILRPIQKKIEENFTIKNKNDVFAPIDGIISKIHNQNDTIIIIFSPDLFSSQVQYSPILGLLYQQIWYAGTFNSEENDEIDETNAKREFVFENSNKNHIILTQKANPICRFLFSFIEDGVNVSPNSHIGFSFLFGKLELRIPSNMKVMVYEGQRCLAKETIIASS